MDKNLNCLLIFLGLQLVSDVSVTLLIEAPEPEYQQFNSTIYATCEVTPDLNLPSSQPKIMGQVLFKQIFPNGTLQAYVNLRGLPEDHKLAIHVHRYGDLSHGCVTAGPHYNPMGVDHPGHPGDMGNFVSKHGFIKQLLKLPEARLFGGQSILGRSVVVHEKEDDLGLGLDEESKRSGNAGKRIAGCVIGITSPSLWQVTVEVPREELKDGTEGGI